MTLGAWTSRCVVAVRPPQAVRSAFMSKQTVGGGELELHICMALLDIQFATFTLGS